MDLPRTALPPLTSFALRWGSSYILGRGTGPPYDRTATGAFTVARGGEAEPSGSRPVRWAAEDAP